MKQLSLLLIMALALFIGAQVAHAATTTVAPGASTLTAAIAAAADGDVLELQTGDYDGTVTVAKSLTIRAAAGQTPVYKPTNPNIKTAVPFTVNSPYTTATTTLVWDGVNITFDCKGNNAMTFKGQGTKATISNCAVTETSNNTSAGVMIADIATTDSLVTFDNCNIDFTKGTAHWRSIYIWATAGSPKLTFKKCTLASNSSNSVFFCYTPTATMEFVDSTVNLNYPDVNIGFWAGSVAVPNENMVFNRCVINCPKALGYCLFYTEGPINWVLTNCAIFWNHDSGNYKHCLQGLAAGTTNVQYCTFVDVNTVATTGTPIVFGDVFNAGATGTCTVKNNIFTSKAALTAGNYVSDLGSANTKVTYVIGKNLVSAPPSTYYEHISAGTVVVGDPKLDADDYHLTKDSALARGAAVDTGVISDIDGGDRPYYGGFDLGCDQYGTVPVELSTFSAE